MSNKQTDAETKRNRIDRFTWHLADLVFLDPEHKKEGQATLEKEKKSGKAIAEDK